MVSELFRNGSWNDFGMSVLGWFGVLSYSVWRWFRNDFGMTWECLGSDFGATQRLGLTSCILKFNGLGFRGLGFRVF